MSARLPDFFIVGAPKCGTTALHSYLSSHPAVFMPQVKEPHFFCRDFTGIARVADLDAYLALFAGAPEGVLTGEASATYLFSDVALADIFTARPDAKAIVMLRDPIEAVRSYHLQMLKGLLEDIEDFDEAWAAQADRAAGRRVPATRPDGHLLLYGEIFRYARQVERLQRIAPEGQRLVLLYEDVFADPAKAYGEVLRFLCLAPDGRTDFPVRNPARRLKNRGLARLYLSPPPLLRRLWAPFRGLAHAAGVYPPEILQALNTRPAVKAPLSPAMEAELKAWFKPDVEALAGLLGRPLDSWRTAR